MAKLHLTRSEFEELALKLRLIEHELNWINSLGEEHSWFKKTRKTRLENEQKAIRGIIDKSIY